jgi:2-oxoglutarate ferredoxin oxidoreductase subunit alpha
MLLRARYLVDVVGYNRVRGLPLRAAELADAITDLVEATVSPASSAQSVEAGSPEHAGTNGRKEAVR